MSGMREEQKEKQKGADVDWVDHPYGEWKINKWHLYHRNDIIKVQVGGCGV